MHTQRTIGTRTMHTLAGLALSVGASASAWADVQVDGLLMARTGVGGTPGVVVSDLRADAYDVLKTHDKATVRGLVIGTGVSVDLELSRMRVLAADARIVVGGPSGDAEIGRPDVAIFRGTVSGDAASRAFVSVTPRGIDAYVLTGGEAYIVTSGGVAGGGRGVASYRTGDVEMEWVPFRCGSDALNAAAKRLHAGAVPNAGDDGTRADPPCRTAQIGVDSDYEYWSIFGSTAGALAYIETNIAAMSEIYLNDVNTNFEITFVRVFDTPGDPWFNDAYNRLFEFQDYWNLNYDGVQRDLAHFFSGLRDGSTGGVAYLPGLCDLDYAYGLSSYLNGSFPYPLQNNHANNWDPFVVAHEIGHNFGAPHTHDIGIDGCAFGDCSIVPNGTIMSYCHGCPGGMTNIRLELHPTMIATQILPYMDSLSCDLTFNCRADFNQDCTLDAFDYDDFVSGYFAYVLSGTGFPDYNNDGTVDAFDYDDFVSEFFGGC